LSDVASLLSSLWARPGPTASSSTDEDPSGSRIDKPSSVSWLNSKAFLFLQVLLDETSLIRVLSNRNLEVAFLNKILK
jgi:hypothetical protein